MLHGVTLEPVTFMVSSRLEVRAFRKRSSESGMHRWTPHPVIVAIRDHKDYLRVLLYTYYITITGWGGPPKECTKEELKSGPMLM